jgi:hypothetical protein
MPIRDDTLGGMLAELPPVADPPDDAVIGTGRRQPEPDAVARIQVSNRRPHRPRTLRELEFGRVIAGHETLTLPGATLAELLELDLAELQVTWLDPEWIRRAAVPVSVLDTVDAPTLRAALNLFFTSEVLHWSRAAGDVTLLRAADTVIRVGPGETVTVATPALPHGPVRWVLMDPCSINGGSRREALDWAARLVEGTPAPRFVEPLTEIVERATAAIAAGDPAASPTGLRKLIAIAALNGAAATRATDAELLGLAAWLAGISANPCMPALPPRLLRVLEEATNAVHVDGLADLPETEMTIIAPVDALARRVFARRARAERVDVEVVLGLVISECLHRLPTTDLRAEARSADDGWPALVRALASPPMELWNARRVALHCNARVSGIPGFGVTLDALWLTDRTAAPVHAWGAASGQLGWQFIGPGGEQALIVAEREPDHRLRGELYETIPRDRRLLLNRRAVLRGRALAPLVETLMGIVGRDVFGTALEQGLLLLPDSGEL